MIRDGIFILDIHRIIKFKLLIGTQGKISKTVDKYIYIYIFKQLHFLF
jgi:hypothetical protein